MRLRPGRYALTTQRGNTLIIAGGFTVYASGLIDLLVPAKSAIPQAAIRRTQEKTAMPNFVTTRISVAPAVPAAPPTVNIVDIPKGQTFLGDIMRTGRRAGRISCAGSAPQVWMRIGNKRPAVLSLGTGQFYTVSGNKATSVANYKPVTLALTVTPTA